MSLFNCKIHLELIWDKHCVLCSAGTAAEFNTVTKLYIPIATLSTKTIYN